MKLHTYKAQKHAFLSFILFFYELEIIYEANSKRFNKFLFKVCSA
jgi:hypothetical protein